MCFKTRLCSERGGAFFCNERIQQQKITTCEWPAPVHLTRVCTEISQVHDWRYGMYSKWRACFATINHSFISYMVRVSDSLSLFAADSALALSYAVPINYLEVI